MRKKTQNSGEDEDSAIMKQIEEIREKINLRERCQNAFTDQMSSTESENERIIQRMRSENQSLREELRHSLNKDHQSIEKLFENRPKSECLALRRRTVQEAKAELDQKVCELKRHANKLTDAKKKKMKKLEMLKQSMNAPLAHKKDEYSSRVRQIENSLDKVQLKTVTAKNINDIYVKVKTQLHDQIRVFPNKLELLENEKREVDQEWAAMKVVHENAMAEVDAALKEKSSSESELRQARKERELTLRQLRRDVKNIERKIEEQQVYLHNLSLSRKLTRVDSAHVQKVANMARKAEERIQIIKQYERQADDLERVTGIPFTNLNGLLWCLRNQINSSESLKDESKKKAHKADLMRAMHARLHKDLDRLKYQHEEMLQRKIEATETETKNIEDESMKKQVQLFQSKRLADDVRTCCESMLSHLIRSTANMSIRIPTPYQKFKTASDEERLACFEACMKAVELIYEKARAYLKNSLLDENNILDMSLSGENNDGLIHENNNRIPAQLERRLSEEFDNYNVTTNDRYVSREMIKQQTEHYTTSRGGRRK